MRTRGGTRTRQPSLEGQPLRTESGRTRSSANSQYDPLTHAHQRHTRLWSNFLTVTHDVLCAPFPVSRGRFSLVSAGGVEGLAFIACNDPTVSTTQLTLRILSNLQSHSLPLPLSPHLSRLLPVHTTASATAVDHILGRFHHLTLHMFTAERVAASSATSPLTFAVVFRASNSRAVQRSEAITALAVRVEEEARKVGASVAVRLVGADISVLCWLVKSVAMLAVLPDYHTHCEYSVDKLRPGSSASNQTHAGSTKDRTSDGAPDAS